MTSPPPDGRRSRLGGDPGERMLLHADLHNHSLLSDGLGDPERAFVQMRAAGLDVAALTDHASIPHHRIEDLDLTQYPDEEALALGRTPPHSIDADGWRRTAEIADAYDVPGEFTALRGFEWTEPWLGHVNVWFSDDWLDVTTPGTVDGLHEWLADEQPDALFGYNHPGREPGRLHDFALPAGLDLTPRMVGLEVFNRTHDYLLHESPSPVVACLDAGWTPGLIGCSDEHGRQYGLAGRGRTGLWARSHDRVGVREALQSRRTYGTREIGLHLDATVDGVPYGGRLPMGSRAELAVDLAGGGYDGRPVVLQLLSGDASGDPAVVAEVDATGGSVTRADVTLPESLRWLLLRVGDPSRPGDRRAGHATGRLASWSVAYATPWWPAT